ncbi:MAG TPA: DNA translocase FtsK 4TM domain-containing protein, partial [Polyangiales bacterium]|nr:DNA translocase FtsK 4TM domain-containing protein [Polyangiales bacterium]
MRQVATNPTSSSEAPGLARRHEILGILCFAAALLSGLALCSYDMRGGANWIGPLGEGLASALVTGFGLTALVVPFELLWAAAYCVKLRPALSGVAHAASVLTHLLLGCALLHLALHDVPVFGGHLAGGAIGEVLGEVLRSIVGTVGAYVVCVSALLITLVLRTSISVVGVSKSVVGFSAVRGKGAAVSMREAASKLWSAWQAAKEIERQEREKARIAAEPKITQTSPGTAIVLDGEDEDEEVETPRAGARASALDDDAGDSEHEDEDEDSDEDDVEEEPAPKSVAPEKKRRDKGPTIVAPKLEAKKKARHEPEAVVSKSGGPFVLPPTKLLAEAPEGTIEVDEATLKDNAVRLVEKLAAYGVKGRVDEIHPGPVVTMYEFDPQSGTKVSKIASLADDLAMALAAQKVRIVAPIPGKARVGFELPNEQRQTVYLRELLEDERWARLQCALPVAFGKDIEGQPVYGDLAKMPHLLVAGATGSGKSVGLNVMLASLLMKKTPEEVRLLMIDPKVVELAVFDGIPHMLLPVVTDMKKASLALRWAVDEMERRYQLFADAGARNLVTYNARVDRVHSGEMSVATFAPRRAGKVRAKGPDGEEVLLDPADGETPDACDEKPEKLPSIVCVVDEFADLMMVAAKDVEAA